MSRDVEAQPPYPPGAPLPLRKRGETGAQLAARLTPEQRRRAEWVAQAMGHQTHITTLEHYYHDYEPDAP